MAAEYRNILVTGYPGVGKTTLIKSVVAQASRLDPVGFYTEEIREAGVRKGFRLATLDGREGLLSHVDIMSRHRVGKYGVDVESLDRFIDKIDYMRPEVALIVIDEIGKMECFSPKFVSFVEEILDSDKSVIATIALKGTGLIASVKKRTDATIFEITRANRDTLAAELMAHFEAV